MSSSWVSRINFLLRKLPCLLILNSIRRVCPNCGPWPIKDSANRYCLVEDGLTTDDWEQMYYLERNGVLILVLIKLSNFTNLGLVNLIVRSKNVRNGEILRLGRLAALIVNWYSPENVWVNMMHKSGKLCVASNLILRSRLVLYLYYAWLCMLLVG